MRLPILLALTAAAILPANAAAQVSGTIVIGGLPVGGVVTFGSPRWVPGPARRVVVMERHAPGRVVVVERWRPSKHYYRGDHRRYSRAEVWYDQRAGRYYDRVRPGLRRVVVYERDGRYYRHDDDKRDRRGGRPDGHGR
jgi:hypothetical protein